MTLERFSELFCQMISEVSGYNVSLDDKIGEACDELDIIEAELRFDSEYGSFLITDSIHYSGRVREVIEDIYNNNPELLTLN